MIARSIDIDHRDPFEPSIEEKLFLAAKRGCFGFAGLAVVLGALDIAGIHSVDEARKMWDSSRVNVASLGDVVRGGIKDISITPASLSFSSSPDMVVVKIPNAQPRVAVKSNPQPVSTTASSALNSPVAALSNARSQDALQMAMAPPMTIRPERSLIEPASLPKAESAPAKVEPKAEIKTEAVVLPKPAPLSALASAPASTPLEILNGSQPAQPSIRLATAETTMPAIPSLAERSITATMDATIPLAEVPLPRAAPGVPPPSPAERLGLTGEGKEKEYSRAERCLANAIYFEARSEPVRGQMAVAQVVVNRAFSGFYPNDICGVVYQNANRHLSCQFTFACDGKRKVINERGNWARANRIAKQTLDGQIYVPEVAKSTHYHAAYVRPNWVHEMKKLVRYG
ncbi:MAG: cell wall hydrolase, partial [Acidobacteriales bacterium]|nr:cell wall hydrolase [Terriglobales bacterium]